MMTVRHPRASLSTVLTFYFRDEVRYYAGDDLAARELAANDFKYWELMRRPVLAAIASLTTDARSVPTPILQEEPGLRAEPPLSHEYRFTSATPPEQPDEPLKYRAFIAMWRRLPAERRQRDRTAYRPQSG